MMSLKPMTMMPVMMAAMATDLRRRQLLKRPQLLKRQLLKRQQRQQRHHGLLLDFPLAPLLQLGLAPSTLHGTLLHRVAG